MRIAKPSHVITIGVIVAITLLVALVITGAIIIYNQETQKNLLNRQASEFAVFLEDNEAALVEYQMKMEALEVRMELWQEELQQALMQDIQSNIGQVENRISRLDSNQVGLKNQISGLPDRETIETLIGSYASSLGKSNEGSILGPTPSTGSEILALSDQEQVIYTDAKDAYKRGNFQEASSLYEDLHKQYPNNKELQLNYVTSQFLANPGQSNFHGEVTQTLNVLLEEEELSAEQKIQALEVLGLVYYETEDWTSSADVYDRLSALVPDKIEYVQNQALSYLFGQEYLGAQILLDQVTERQPENGEYWYYNGLSYFYAGNYTHAAMRFTKAISLNPNLPATYLMLGKSHLGLEQYEVAIEALTQYVEKSENYEGLKLLGESYFLQGEYGQARTRLEDALTKISPTSPSHADKAIDIYTLLAQATWEQSDYSSSLLYSGKGRIVDDHDPLFKSLFGRALIDSGETEEGKTLLAQVIDTHLDIEEERSSKATEIAIDTLARLEQGN